MEIFNLLEIGEYATRIIDLGDGRP